MSAASPSLETRLKDAVRELCEHLGVRLALEQVYDERTDVVAFASLKRAKFLLEELRHE